MNKANYTNEANYRVRAYVSRSPHVYAAIEIGVNESDNSLTRRAHCYFNTLNDFFDWIDKLIKIREELKLKLSNRPEAFTNEVWSNNGG